MDIISQKSIKLALNNATAKHKDRIGNNDLLFLERIYSDGIDKYIDRLKAIGLTNRHRVLDAGSGYGQWSLALSVLNQSVDCCDISPIRIKFFNDLINELNIDNVRSTTGRLENLNYDDEAFDAIFCYSVLYISDPMKSLDELIRVLKPGGTLYLCSNGIGWYFYNIEQAHNSADDFDPRQVAMEAIDNTFAIFGGEKRKKNSHTIVPGYKIQDTLRKSGFFNIKYGEEGTLKVTPDVQLIKNVPKSFFPGKYKGFEAVFEILATKNR